MSTTAVPADLRATLRNWTLVELTSLGDTLEHADDSPEWLAATVERITTTHAAYQAIAADRHEYPTTHVAAAAEIAVRYEESRLTDGGSRTEVQAILDGIRALEALTAQPA